MTTAGWMESSPAGAAHQAVNKREGKPVISTRSIKELPDPMSLKRLLQSLAMLDALMEPTW